VLPSAPVRSFATKPRSKKSGSASASKSPSRGKRRSSSGKRARSASGTRYSRKAASSAGARKRRSASAKEAREAEAEKKERARERKAEQRERRDAKEAEKKERRRARKEDLRARRHAREAEDADRRKERRALKVERNREKRELTKEKERAARVKEKQRAFRRRREPGSPGMPRVPMAFFVKEKWATASGDTAPERMKNLAHEWKALSEEQKKPYIEKSLADKERFKREFMAWRNENPERPSRPLSAYMLWSIKERPKLLEEQPALKGGGQKTIAEIGQLMGQRWKQLSEADKQPFIQEAQSRSSRYQAEVEKWKLNMQSP